MGYFLCPFEWGKIEIKFFGAGGKLDCGVCAIERDNNTLPKYFVAHLIAHFED